MATKIQVRRDTAANWRIANPVLSQGEPGLEIDTNKLKYGNGTTLWNDLPYASRGEAFTRSGSTGKPVGLREVSGIKSFTFETTGHRFVSFTAGNSLDGATTMVVDASVYPNIRYTQEAFNNESGLRYYVNGVQQNNCNNVTVNGDIYTLTTDGSVTCSPGDQILISAWARGTQAVFPDYGSSGGHVPLTAATNTNTIRLDLSGSVGSSTDDYNLSYNGITYNATASLTAYPGQNFIVFNPLDFENKTRTQRKITNAVKISGTTWDITFDGTPLSAGQRAVSLPVQASFDYEGNKLYINAKNYPELQSFDPYTAGTVVKVNGTPVANFDNFFPWNPQNVSMDPYGNWLIPLNTSIAYTISDTIVLEFTHTDYARIDYYIPNLHDNSTAYYNNAYRWFDWNSDVPRSVDQKGNGVRGGMIQGYVSVYDTETKSTERTMFNNFFDIRNNGSWQYPMVGFNGPDGDQMYGDFLGNDGEFGDQNYIYYDFYEAGIFFSKAPWNQDYQYIARDLKVDIVYKMSLFVDSTDDDWC